MQVISPDRNFEELLQAQFGIGHFVCMGLDPVWERIPLCVPGRFEGDEPDKLEMAVAYYNFCVMIVDETYDLVAAYKPNTAFFEAAGGYGYLLLELLIKHIHRVAPGVVVIVDAKRADIGKTNIGSVRLIFDVLGADAVTVNPYFGGEALAPFLERQGKGVIVLVRTSNPGAKEFQSLVVGVPIGELEDRQLDPEWERVPLYQRVASSVGEWPSQGSKLVVVGATAEEELPEVRSLLPGITILLPGVGAQGGKLQLAVLNGMTADGTRILLNSGSKDLYASSGHNFAQVTRERVAALNNVIRKLLNT